MNVMHFVKFIIVIREPFVKFFWALKISRYTNKLLTGLLMIDSSRRLCRSFIFSSWL